MNKRCGLRSASSREKLGPVVQEMETQEMKNIPGLESNRDGAEDDVIL